jgi:hypothetical protein
MKFYGIIAPKVFCVSYKGIAMYTIVAPVPHNLATALEPYRQKFDPQANLAPAHISILEPFQFAAASERLYAHLSEISEIYAPIRIFVIGWDVFENKEYHLHLPMTAGQSELTALRQDILSGLLSNLCVQSRPYRPAVCFGRLTESDQLQTVKRELKGFEPQFNFRVAHIELWRRDNGTHPWKLEIKFSLKATVVGQSRR